MKGHEFDFIFEFLDSGVIYSVLRGATSTANAQALGSFGSSYHLSPEYGMEYSYIHVALEQ